MRGSRSQQHLRQADQEPVAQLVTVLVVLLRRVTRREAIEF